MSDMFFWRVGLGLLAWLLVGLGIGHLFGRWVKKHYPNAVREE